ncbi:MAG: hypothetical protein HY660_05960 [Armatimonadetes bacterium]|nr:hypothetical protein [Armatimonadota bacterium]
MPADAVIEMPAVVGTDGVTPRAARGPVPPDVVALTQHNCAYETLLVDTILEGSFAAAWRAMTMNLLVRHAAQDRALVEYILADSPTGREP